MCTSTPDIPDTSAAQMAAIAAQTATSDKQLGLQADLIDYYKQRQTQTDAQAAQVADRQMQIAQTASDQGTDIFNYQKQVFRPVEESMVSQAMAESTPAYYEQFARDAIAKQATANANAQGQTERNLTSLGVNPNSGAFVSAQRGLQLANAAGLGQVANTARTQAEALSWAHKADVAGIGKGLVGAGNGSYGVATSADNAATGARSAADSTAVNSLGNPVQYGQLGITAGGNATQAYNDIYRTQVQAATTPQQSSGLAGALGAAAGTWAGSTTGSAWLTKNL